jgi:DNA-binding LacI/PurR family transcriptional regulator
VRRETAAARKRSFTSLAAAERAAAVLLVSLPPTDAEVAHYEAAAKPVILVDCEHPALSSVVIDDEAGGRIAAEHLLGLGHDRLAFVGDAPDPAARFLASSRRRRGFVAALARAGRRLRRSGSWSSPSTRSPPRARRRGRCSSAATGPPRSSPPPTRWPWASSRPLPKWDSTCPPSSR